MCISLIILAYDKHPQMGTKCYAGGRTIQSAHSTQASIVKLIASTNSAARTDNKLFSIYNSTSTQIMSFHQLIGDDMNGYYKYRGCVLDGTGRYVHCIPYKANKILRIDTDDDSMVHVGGDFGNGGAKWYGGVLGPDNCIYATPYCHKQILKYDIETQQTSFVGEEFDGYRKWVGCAVGDDNCVYFIPWNHSRVLKFDIANDRTSFIGQDLGSGGGKWCGGVKGDDNIGL